MQNRSKECQFWAENKRKHINFGKNKTKNKKKNAETSLKAELSHP